jgi:hypothetical protein
MILKGNITLICGVSYFLFNFDCMKEKKCTGCKKVKDVSEFHIRHAGSSGYASRCKECYKMKAINKKKEKDYMDQFSIM